VDPLGVFPGGHQELAGELKADSEAGDEVGCGEGDQGCQLAVQCLGLGVEGPPAAGQVAQRGLDPGQQQSLGVAGQLEQVIDLGAQPQGSG